MKGPGPDYSWVNVSQYFKIKIMKGKVDALVDSLGDLTSICSI